MNNKKTIFLEVAKFFESTLSKKWPTAFWRKDCFEPQQRGPHKVLDNMPIIQLIFCQDVKFSNGAFIPDS